MVKTGQVWRRCICLTVHERYMAEAPEGYEATFVILPEELMQLLSDLYVPKLKDVILMAPQKHPIA